MDKLKVLIADDEFFIRDGIKSSVNWDQFNMEVVGEAEDGEEAVELAVKHQVDILLIDLNMPIMNGINAMKQLKEVLPHCKMIVISGYDDFSYAQESIRLQVEDYILKPVNPEKLKQLLREVKQHIENEVKQGEYLKQAENQIRKNHSQLKERFFQDWVENRLTEEAIMEQLQFLRLPTTTPKQHMVIKWPEHHQNQTYMQEKDRQIYLFAVENIANEILEPNLAVVFRDQYDLLNACIWDEVTTEQMINIEESVKNYLEVNISIHVEDVNDSRVTKLYKIYDSCKTNVDKKIRLSPIVKQAQEYLHQHYTDSGLTLESIAKHLHVSTVYLSKMIKQELGISYVSLVTQMRINKAVDLLKTTDMTIRDISEEVGYDSQHYFSTAFKKIVGKSPIQFKKETSTNP